MWLTHTPSSLCSLGILLSLFFFPLLCSLALSVNSVSPFLSFPLPYICFLSCRQGSPFTLPLSAFTHPLHTPIAHVSYPAIAGLIMLHMSIHSFYTICSKAESFMSHSNLGQGCSKSLSWLKKNPVLHEIICLMFSISFPLCCKMFLTLFIIWLTLGSPGLTYFEQCVFCGNAARRCSLSIIICLYPFFPSRHTYTHRSKIVEPASLSLFCINVYDLCHSTSYFSWFPGRHPAANDCSRPSCCL